MTTLREILEDTSVDVGFVVEIEGRNTITDVVTTHRFQNRGRQYTAEGYRACLEDPGDRGDTVEVDNLAAIGAMSLGVVRLLNLPEGPGQAGPLDHLRDYTFAGRRVTVYAGHSNEPVTEYEHVSQGAVDSEPVFASSSVSFERKTLALGRLSGTDLAVNSYVGEPAALVNLIATSVGRANAPYTATHDLRSFTISCRARFALGGLTEAVIQKGNTSSALNFQILQLSGAIRFRWSEGGVLKSLQGPSVNGAVQAVAAGFDAGRNAYLMVDGEVFSQATPATPDLPAVGVRFGSNARVGLELFDLRIYSQYIDPDEMRSVISVAASDGATGLVGHWRGDDYAGNVLSDHSATGADATITGSEGVDYEWATTGLGGQGLAGRSMPALIGDVYNAPAELVDADLEVYRVSDRPQENLLSIYERQVFDQGELLADGTDYDWPDHDVTYGAPTFALAGAAGEPVTVGVDTRAAGSRGLPEHVLREILVERGPFQEAEIDISRWEALYPAQLGMATRRRALESVAAEVLAGGLGYLHTLPDGRLRADAVLPPVSPAPRGGPCLEIINTSTAAGRVQWAGAWSHGWNFTIAAWVKTHSLGPADSGANGRTPFVTLQSQATLSLMLDTAWGAPSLRLEPQSGIYSAASGAWGAFYGDPWVWYFIAAVHDGAAGQTRFYVGKEGDPVKLVATSNALGLPNVPYTVEYVELGGDMIGRRNQRGSVVEPQLWSKALSLAELQAASSATPAPTVSLEFLATCRGTSAAALYDIGGGVTGTILGSVRQVPDATIDLRLRPQAAFSTRKLRPARDIKVHYRPNFAPLSLSEFAAAVTSEQRQALSVDHLVLPHQDANAAEDYLDAREITVKGLWSTEAGAQAALRLARYRYGAEREAATVADAGRAAVALRVGDEVLMIGERWDLNPPGITYRVISNQARLAALTGDLGLFR